jgi:hypothetical protein
MVIIGTASNEACDMLVCQAYHTPQGMVVDAYGALYTMSADNIMLINYTLDKPELENANSGIQIITVKST